MDFEEVLSSIIMSLQMERTPKERYGDILFQVYNNRRKTFGLPAEVPDVVVEAVKRQVHKKPESNLKECIIALDAGIAQYIKNRCCN